MNEKTKQEGQRYSNNVIESMQTTLNKLDSGNDDLYEKGYEELYDCLGITKETVINYLISWGGPAYRLQITFDGSEIIKVVPQYQDWFTEWTTIPTTSKQNTTLLNFVYALGLEETI